MLNKDGVFQIKEVTCLRCRTMRTPTYSESGRSRCVEMVSTERHRKWRSSCYW